MNATPMICPGCGELIIAWPDTAETLVLPVHPDRITPWVDCIASACAVTVRYPAR